MPIPPEQQAVVNRLKEWLRGPLSQELADEIRAALKEHNDRQDEGEKSEVRKWADRQLARLEGLGNSDKPWTNIVKVIPPRDPEQK